MRWLAAAVLAAVLAALAITMAATHASATGTERRLSGQIASLQRQLSGLRSELAAVAVKTGGSHRDLITCADVLNMGWNLSGTDSSGGQLTGIAGPGPISLPAHCVNQ